MNNARRALKDIESSDLRQLWNEIKAWEEEGNLPPFAALRTLTDQVFKTQHTLLQLDFVTHEVWREAAVRAIFADEVQS